MTYTISDLEQLSGIQSHTIRIWEQRYHALIPSRSKGNTRFYNDEQLVRLLNIVTLNHSGLKISKVCALSDVEVKELIEQQQQNNTSEKQVTFAIAQLIKYGIAFDEIAFSLLLDQSIAKIGMLACYRNVIYPLLGRLGFMWRVNNMCPAHEHFMSGIIRQKILAEINVLPLAIEDKITWLLFLPEEEDHEIGLLFANFMLRFNGQKVVYLGSKVPLHSIERILNTFTVDNVLLFMVKSRSATNAQKYIDQLSIICSSTQIYLAGNGDVIGKIKTNDNINWLKNLDEFEHTIQKSILK